MTHPTRPAHRHTLLLAAAALGCALALSGCAAQNPALAAQQPAVKLTTGNFLSTIEAAQKKAGSAHEHIVTTAAKQTATIDGDISGLADTSKLAIRENLTISGKPAWSLIDVDKKVYINLGKDTGNAYLALSGAAASSPAGKASDTINDAISQSNLLTQQAAMKEGIQYVQRAGDPTTIDGISATPFVVGVDTAPLADTLSSAGVSSAALPPQIDIDYWIGTDGLPRRISLLVGGVDEEAYFTHWGAAVVITAPTAPPAAAETTAAWLPRADPLGASRRTQS